MAQNRLMNGIEVDWKVLKWEEEKETERVGTLCCEGSGRPSCSDQLWGWQLSDRKPVNNRGSDPGHLAPWQSAHFSSITLILSVAYGSKFSQSWGYFQCHFHQQERTSITVINAIFSVWLNSNVTWNSFGPLSASSQRKTLQFPGRFKESEVAEIADITYLKWTSVGQTQPQP